MNPRACAYDRETYIDLLCYTNLSIPNTHRWPYLNRPGHVVMHWTGHLKVKQLCKSFAASLSEWVDNSFRIDSVRRDRCFAVGIFRRPPNLIYISCTFTIYSYTAHESYSNFSGTKIYHKWLMLTNLCRVMQPPFCEQVLNRVCVFYGCQWCLDTVR